MELILWLVIAVVGYFIYNKFQGNKNKDTSLIPSQHYQLHDVFRMEKGWLIDFHDNFILKGFPVEEFNMLEYGPYEVVDINKTTSTTEYALRGSRTNAVLEIEKKGDRNSILIQTGLENYPSLLPQIKKVWKEDIEQFEFKGVKYFLVEDGEEEDGGYECYYWDYYSDQINEGNKLFIGVQDYGEEGYPELKFFVGFEIPERSIKEVLPKG